MLHAKIKAEPFDPEDLHGLRARINAETGGEYAALRSSLTPDYAAIWRDIAGGYVALAAIVALVGLAGIAAMPPGAIAIGFTIAHLQLFIHEAAHFGLAPDRETNDRLANRLICWQVGTDIASYRATHWEHHRSLGGAGDTEVSYRNALNIGFVAAMLTGVHALRVFTSRKHAPAKQSARSIRPLAVGAAVHLLIVSGLIAAGWWPAALAWIGGMAIFFPFFATMRQLLEHRPATGGGDTAAVTRLFGDDPFSRVFGGAGFNRHMIHHLEPQVSCSRLSELEAFLMTTSARAELDARRSTYWGAFTALVRSDRHD